MSDSNTESKALTSPIDNVGYDSDSKFDESQELLPNEKRSNNVIEGNLLRDWEGFIQLVKTYLATGILGIPFAMKNAGIVIGPPLIVIMSLIAAHCMIILTSSSQIICKQLNLPFADYGKTAELSIIRIFPKKAHYFRRFVNCLIPIMQYGFCSTYVLFMAESLRQITGHFDIRVWCLLLMPVLIIFCYIHSLDILSYTTSVGNICLVISLIIIYQQLYRGFQNIRRLTLIGPSIPTASGVVLFSLEGICTVLPLENRMKKPENYSKVIWSSQLFVTLNYLLMAIGGYLHYGDDTLGSVTFNLPKTPLYLAVRGLYATSIFFSYLLQFYVPTNLIFKFLRNEVLTETSEIKLISLELAYRTIVVLITGSLAIAIPKLGLFISLIGATTGSLSSLILPALIQIGTYYSYCSEVPKWLIIKNLIILIIGILCCFSGTYTTIYRLVLAFNGHSADHQSYHNNTQT